MSEPKTPQQIEDADVNDAVRTAISLELRRFRRSLENYVWNDLHPQIASARVEGRTIDVDALITHSLNTARKWIGNYGHSSD